MTETNITKRTLSAALRDLEKLPAPEPESVSKREAIEELAPVLRRQLQAGWTYAQLAARLEKHGIAITADVLKKYLRASPRSESVQTRSVEPASAQSVNTAGATSAHSEGGLD